MAITHTAPTAGALAALLSSILVLDGQTTAPYGRIDKPKFQKLANSILNFELDYPRSDWKVLSGHGAAILTIVETKRGEAIVVIERSRLGGALTPDKMALAIEPEVQTVRDGQAGYTDLQQQMMEAEGRQFIVIQYYKPGLNGREHVIRYVFPIGENIYRVICSTSELLYKTKYASIFGHMAASFRTTSSATE